MPISRKHTSNRMDYRRRNRQTNTNREHDMESTNKRNNDYSYEMDNNQGSTGKSDGEIYIKIKLTDREAVRFFEWLEKKSEKYYIIKLEKNGQ